MVLSTLKTSLLLIASCLSLTILGQTPFGFRNTTIQPGSRENLLTTLSDGKNETIVPITILHGKQDGPVLGLTAGVHGYEYAPILAGQQLIKSIDPKTLKGTVIMVNIANVGSFQGRSPFVNPMDGKNLNRSFPGNESGTITERIAHFISQDIIRRCDYFVDIHSGDASEDLMAYSAYYHHDNLPEISESGKQMAMSMGFDHVIVFNTSNSDYMKEGFPSLYCSAEAFKQGIPAADIECGRLGMIEEKYVAKIFDAIVSLLKQLDMTTGEPIQAKGTLFIEDRSYLSSSQTGFFYPLKAAGDYVRKGMKIGYITDYFNQVIDEIYAGEDGLILYMMGTPPVNQGETLVSLGKIKTE